MTFRLTMHPGMDGDCLVLTWGTTAELHHIVVDLGRGGSYRALESHFRTLQNVELFVMSHVDADHIGGAVPFVRRPVAAFTPRRIWYDARPQLAAAVDRRPILEPFGARQGEKLARGIVKFGWNWNRDFASEIVSTDSPEAAEPIPIADGLAVRLLSPGDAQLAALLPEWDTELARAKIRTFDPDEEDDPLAPHFEPLGGAPNVEALAREPFVPDSTRANGSSIAFIAEFEGKRVLFAADAHADVLEASLAPLAAAAGGRYPIDLVKVSHHGSRGNTSNDLLAQLDCSRFAFSTNGTRHGHPDPETIARLLTADGRSDPLTLYFNYRQPASETWESARLQTRWGYSCVFPDRGDDGTLAIDI